MNSPTIEVKQWIDQVANLAKPSKIYWCNGSDEEYRDIVSLMLDSGQLLELNNDKYPRCYLHRSDPNDVARTEHLTFICTEKKEDAGPNNNWMSPEEGHKKFDNLFSGSMQGRTMYVIPYCMGPIDSPYSRCGIEVTDSPYVVANMKIMTRMGEQALKKIEEQKTFVKGYHCTGDLSMERRLILHFPDELEIKSIGSGYGGNALLGKKCHALRVASVQGKKEGWLAEHMLILGVENPQGEVHYMTAAFPSACGKTNLAMLIPPEQYKGWKIWTVGDDIAWLHLGEDGRLWAINPEAGFFGVAPGTSNKTNPNALNMLYHDSIFTNVALTKENTPWWEGMDGEPVLDWKGQPFDGKQAAAHPNSRFTVSSKQCSSYSQQAENPQGVPISAMIFGGRRPSLIPLVNEAQSWSHGVLMGASVSSETTAAATGKVGVLRRDPMAMKPFCGYNFADYWQHWLDFEKKSQNLPKIFQVNWFRQNAQGKFVWPGFGENIRVLEWIISRVQDDNPHFQKTPIGNLPRPVDINTKGTDVSQTDMEQLTSFDKDGWKEELRSIGSYFEQYGSKLPEGIKKQYEDIS